MKSAVRRYIEEEEHESSIKEHPVYLPGDTIRLRVRIVHEVNLGKVWAVFHRVIKVSERGSKATGENYYITLAGKHYPLSRAEGVRSSEVHFEIEVSRDLNPPGDYELEAVCAYPYELDGREDLVMEFEHRGRICFRIAEEEYARPSARVTGWRFD